jgi:aminoglycoside phosphotransferase (APT) family kinase protein
MLEKMCEVAPPGLVHGDLVSKNVRVGRSGDNLAFLAFDWENAGWGSSPVDLSWFADRTVNPDLLAYGEALKLDFSTVRQLAECGRIFRLLESIHWASSCLCYEPYDWLSKPLARLQVYESRLGDAIGGSTWNPED